MKRVDIIFNIYMATEHPMKTLERLGITYKKAVPQSIGDCWWFFGVENLPSELPEDMSIHDFGNLNRLVGYGLTHEDVKILQG